MATLKTAGRRFQPPWRFRLRTLLIVISAVSLVTGWQVERLRRRARAGELIKHWGLWVAQEEPATRGEFWGLIPDSVHPRLLEWSAPCLAVTTYPLGDNSIWIKRAQRTARGEIGWLASSDVFTRRRLDPPSAECKRLVAGIAEFTELRLLDVPFPLDDDDLRALSRLTSLECLRFCASRVSKSAVKSLQKFRKLESLSVRLNGSGCPTVETVAGLGELPCLERVSLSPISDTARAQITAALPRIELNGVITPPDPGQRDGQGASPRRR
jgi:hypothetical protein